jgi:hypothetical protein
MRRSLASGYRGHPLAIPTRHGWPTGSWCWVAPDTTNAQQQAQHRQSDRGIGEPIAGSPMHPDQQKADKDD